MKYQNMGSYAHFAPYLKVMNPFSFRNIKKKRCKSVVSAKNMYQSLNAIRS